MNWFYTRQKHWAIALLCLSVTSQCNYDTLGGLPKVQRSHLYSTDSAQSNVLSDLSYLLAIRDTSATTRCQSSHVRRVGLQSILCKLYASEETKTGMVCLNCGIP